jgi:hypothetical protein
MIWILLSCAESFEVLECTDEQCRTAFGLGSQCIEESPDGPYCEDLILPSSCNSYPSGLDKDWDSHRTSPLIGSILPREDSYISGLGLAEEHIREQASALGAGDIAPVIVDCPADQMALLVETLGAQVIVGPAENGGEAYGLEGYADQVVYLSPVISATVFDVAADYFWSLGSREEIGELSQLLEETSTGSTITPVHLVGAEKESYLADLQDGVTMESPLVIDGEISAWAPSALSGDIVFLGDASADNTAFVARLEELAAESSSVQPGTLYLTSTGHDLDYGNPPPFPIRGIASVHPSLSSVGSLFSAFAAGADACDDMELDDGASCLDTAKTYDAIWLALRLELNRKQLLLRSASELNALLESYDESSLDETDQVLLNGSGLLNMFRLTSSNQSFNLVGPSGPLIFDGGSHERNQLLFRWAIGVE